MKLPISNIKIEEGRRAADARQIKKLEKSIAEIGLLNPITVDPNYTLIAGLHRLNAVKALGWTEIDCNVTDLEGIEAKLAEIDENIMRTNLTVQQQADMLKRRKLLYETLHPETKAGIAQANGMNKALGKNVSCAAQSTHKSFIQDTADKLGVHPSTVSRYLRIGTQLTEKTMDILSDMEKAPTQASLAKLCSLPPIEQEKAAELLAAGAIRSVDEYVKMMSQPETGNSAEAGECDEEENVLTEKQEEAVMAVSYLAEYVSGHSGELYGYKNALLQLPAEWVEQLAEMADEIRAVYEYLDGIVEQVREIRDNGGGAVDPNDHA